VSSLLELRQDIIESTFPPYSISLCSHSLRKMSHYVFHYTPCSFSESPPSALTPRPPPPLSLVHLDSMFHLSVFLCFSLCASTMYLFTSPTIITSLHPIFRHFRRSILRSTTFFLGCIPIVYTTLYTPTLALSIFSGECIRSLGCSLYPPPRDCFDIVSSIVSFRLRPDPTRERCDIRNFAISPLHIAVYLSIYHCGIAGLRVYATPDQNLCPVFCVLLSCAPRVSRAATAVGWSRLARAVPFCSLVHFPSSGYYLSFSFFLISHSGLEFDFRFSFRFTLCIHRFSPLRF